MKDVWLAELVKIRTVTGQRVGLLLAALALPLTSLLVVTSGGLGERDTVTSGAATGTLVGLLGFGAWAASVTGGEYVHRTITVSLSAVPHRARLYGAKVAAAATLAGTGALLAATASVAVVHATTPVGHRLGTPASLVFLVLASVAVASVGVAVGVLTRSTTSAIAVVAAALILPKSAAGLLGGLQPWVVGASPATVVTQFVHGAQLPADQTFPGGPALAAATMLAVAALVTLLAGLVLTRRDA